MQEPSNAPVVKKDKRKWWVILLICLLLLIMAGVGTYFWYMGQQKAAFELYQFDTEALEGRIQQMTEEEIQAELNRVVEEGMFNISIASSIVFDGPGGQGQARIENIAANRYHMQVDIFLTDTWEKIYSGKLIRPGYSVEYITLDKQLPPGEYDVTAIFSAITQEEMQLFGQAGAQIKLYIPDENGYIPVTVTEEP
ncbi:MAG: hypothetical protein IKT57_04800 [Clostridia bacterium]|nr:hypothetical protein [Clostridia bacterium]